MDQNKKSIFHEVLELGIEFDNHESDLYIPVNDQTRALIARHPESQPVLTFKNQNDGKQWYDLAFKYLAFWDNKTGKKTKLNLWSSVLFYQYDHKDYVQDHVKNFGRKLVKGVVSGIENKIYTVTYTNPNNYMPYDYFLTRDEIKHVLTSGL